jgi:hypothetical protein
MSNTTVAKKIGHGIGGFTLSLAMIVLTAVSLQVIITSIWTPPQSFLIAYGTAMAIPIIAISLSWICLLNGLRNKAMIRGVWYQIYACVGIAIVGLIVVLFF